MFNYGHTRSIDEFVELSIVNLLYSSNSVDQLLNAVRCPTSFNSFNQRSFILMMAEEGLDVILAMWKLERGIYRCASPEGCEADARASIVQWSFQILQFLHLDAMNIAPIALNYVDRYVSVHANILKDRTKYLLVSMTALYLAIKVHGTGVLLDPQAIRTLSRETYTVHEIEAQELQLLMTLQWRLHPPTVVQYVRHLVRLLPCREQQELVEWAALQKIESSYKSGDSSAPAFHFAVQLFLAAVRKCEQCQRLPHAKSMSCLLAEFIGACQEDSENKATKYVKSDGGCTTSLMFEQERSPITANQQRMFELRLTFNVADEVAHCHL